MAGEAIPPWLVTGNGPFGCTITPHTAAAGGALSPVGSALTLENDLDDVEVTFTDDLENIKPMSKIGANNVGTNEDFEVTLIEIYKDDGSNILPPVAVYKYFHVVLTLGDETPWEFWGRRNGFRISPKNGKSTFQLGLKRIETGTTNPIAP